MQYFHDGAQHRRAIEASVAADEHPGGVQRINSS
jgi:hypothetical protein